MYTVSLLKVVEYTRTLTLLLLLNFEISSRAVMYKLALLTTPDIMLLDIESFYFEHIFSPCIQYLKVSESVTVHDQIVKFQIVDTYTKGAKKLN